MSSINPCRYFVKLAFEIQQADF